jgi:site-specific DNA-adenine methylase
MKTSIYLTTALLTFFFASCNKEDSLISALDKTSIDGMVESLNAATLENDSCITTFSDTDPTSFHYHDSLYHLHAANFNHHHDSYSHGNDHDDHEHMNGQMSHHNGNMNHNDEDGHHEIDHTEMDNLNQDHQSRVH